MTFLENPALAGLAGGDQIASGPRDTAVRT